VHAQKTVQVYDRSIIVVMVVVVAAAAVAVVVVQLFK